MVPPHAYQQQVVTPPPAYQQQQTVTPQQRPPFSREEVHERNTGYGESLNQGGSQIRKQIRNYFFGMFNFFAVIPVGVGGILIGIGTEIIDFWHMGEALAFFISGGFLILLGILSFFIRIRGLKGEEEVLAARASETENLRKRAIEKLGVDESQISLIEPIVLSGYGASPDASLNEERGRSGKRKLRRLIRGAYDPVEAYRVGKMNVLHSLLIQVSYFFFTETQLMIYTGNVDISTGKIYEETTTDVYYQDIGKISTKQRLWKLWKNRKAVYKISEEVSLLVQGTLMTFSISADVDNSKVDNQIAGMKALVREKKN